MVKERPWRGLVYPFIKMTKYTVVLLFKLASFFLPSSRAKLGPQSLVIFVEYKVTFFVSVTYYAWFSLISKEHNITISQVSEKIWFRSGIYSRLKTRCKAHLTFLSPSSGSVNSSWPSPAAQLYSDRKPRACQKFGVGPGVGKCPAPWQRKICKRPTPGTGKAGKCPAVAGGVGAGRGWNWLMHNFAVFTDCYFLFPA